MRAEIRGESEGVTSGRCHRYYLVVNKDKLGRRGTLSGPMTIRIEGAMWSEAQGQKDAVATVLIGGGGGEGAGGKRGLGLPPPRPQITIKVHLRRAFNEDGLKIIRGEGGIRIRQVGEHAFLDPPADPPCLAPAR